MNQLKQPTQSKIMKVINYVLVIERDVNVGQSCRHVSQAIANIDRINCYEHQV